MDSNIMLLKRNGLSKQVTGILEKRILSGKYAVGRRLPSMMNLAEDFGVSQQVIKSAVGEMSRKNLLVTSHRDGVYVNPEAFLPCKREFIFLNVHNPGNVDNYMSLAMGLYDDTLWNDANFSVRLISYSGSNIPLLCHELENIKDLHPDCIIVKFASDKKSIEHFQSQRFPVIFFGDFDWEDGNGQANINQIVEDTAERAESLIGAVCNGTGNVVMVGGQLRKYYGRTLNIAAERKAFSMGMKFRHIEGVNSPCHDEEALFIAYQDCVKRIIDGGTPDAVILDGFPRMDIFTRAVLETAGLQPGRDIQIINDRDPFPGITYLRTDYKEFSRQARILIDNFVANPGKKLGRVVLSGLIKRVPVKITHINGGI